MRTPVRPGEPHAVVGDQLGRDLLEVSDDPDRLDEGGRWAVLVRYEGGLTLARFAHWSTLPEDGRLGAPAWTGPDRSAWRSSLDRDGYVAAVEAVRAAIAEGTVYQVNVCRVLEAALGPGETLVGLGDLLRVRHPAPHGASLHLPGHDIDVVSASPELFLRRRGDRIWSSPIKGTGRTRADLGAKDRAENVMIVDLVRNDLARVSLPGSVQVEALLVPEHHPGLVHLVSTVAARLVPGTGWRDVLAAAFPAGSITGAPKITARAAISALEPVPRGAYCGAVGVVDADAGTASLAVGIRTFERVGQVLRFGAGAGITWASDAAAEWRETELKAARLLDLASCASG